MVMFHYAVTIKVVISFKLLDQASPLKNVKSEATAELCSVLVFFIFSPHLSVGLHRLLTLLFFHFHAKLRKLT